MPDPSFLLDAIDLSRMLDYFDAAGRFIGLNWLFQASVLLLAALLLVRIPRLRPAVRHQLLLAALLVASVPPLARLADLRVSIASVRGTQERHTELRPVQLPFASFASQVDAPRAFAPRTLPTVSAPPAVTELPWGALLVGVWLVVAAGWVIRLTGGILQVRGWRRYATPVDRRRLNAAGGYAVADLVVLESASVPVPCAAGIGTPAILLPKSLAHDLSDRELRHVLLHEAAHLRRRDPLGFLLAEAAGAMLWWHPLAGLVRREIEVAAEDACDTLVLSQRVEGAAYARTLLTVLENASAARAFACRLGLGGPELRRRVLRILSAAPACSPLAGTLATMTVVVSTGAAAALQCGDRPQLPQIAVRLASDRVNEREPRATLPVPLRGTGNVPAARSRVAHIVSASARTGIPSVRPILLPAGPHGLPGPERLSSQASLGDAALLEPRANRTVVFALDISSSMRPHRDSCATDIMAAIERLGPDDRFNVVAFASTAQSYAGQPVLAAFEEVEGIRSWLRALPQATGTDLERGLTTALAMEGVTSVVLYSDGQPSQGARGEALLTSVGRENRHAARVLVAMPESRPAGEGADLLLKVALGTGGSLHTLRPEPSEAWLAPLVAAEKYLPRPAREAGKPEPPKTIKFPITAGQKAGSVVP